MLGPASSSEVAPLSHGVGASATTGTDAASANVAKLVQAGDCGEEVPNGQYLRLFRNPQTNVPTVVHTMTLEQATFPEASWRIIVDEDGWGAVEDTDGVLEAVALEDRFNNVLLQHEDGSFHVQVMSEGKVAQQFSLSKKMEQFIDVTLRIPMGPMLLEAELKFALLSWPRSGFRFFASAHELYDALNLQSFSKQRSKWSYASFGSWHRFVGELLGNADHHVLPSAHASQSEDVNILRPQHGLPLFEGSYFSSAALLALLARWAGASPAKGGLKGDRDRGASKDLLDGLLLSALAMPEATLPVYLDQAWVPKWPAKDADPDGYLPLGVDGSVHLRALLAPPLSNFKVARDWHRALQKQLNAEIPEKLPVGSVLRLLAGSVALRSLFAQAVWALARHLEYATFWSYKKGPCNERCVQAHAKQIEQVLDQPHALRRELLRYVGGMRLATETVTAFSMSVDKAQIGRVGLLNGIMALPNNVGMILVPQVCVPFKSAEKATDRHSRAVKRAAQCQRARAWLKRDTAHEKDQPGWKTRKRQRISTQTWLEKVDNQLRCSTSLPGLVFIEPVLGDGAWDASVWSQWPRCVLSSDQGGDGLSAIHAALYKEDLELNIWPFWDWCRGANRDVIATFTSGSDFNGLPRERRLGNPVVQDIV
ncbi:unnamed protein product [Prorocentrum cordatum]|uniref:Uncharacterized protein n=1 Tax=Prorocentrum cordatum TaxID=2364126 RepID=A0ABN9VN68_9DINO|nr:unnamed protein product [Polarella glacialis]